MRYHSFKKHIIAVSLLTLSSYSYAANWLQADLQYNQHINGKEYPVKVTLLRPES